MGTDPKPIITQKGLEEAKAKLKKLENDLNVLLLEKGEVYETGGNQWHDNPGFDEALQRESVLRKEINKFTSLIGEARVVQNSTRSSAVTVGSVVTLRFDDGQKKRFTIVGVMQADPTKRLISYESPLGAALLGAQVGDTREYEVGGVSKSVVIIEVS